jgi:hypothetical protein
MYSFGHFPGVRLTPGKYPKEYIQYSKHGESLKSSYTIFFIIVNALHVSGGFSAHHQELKNWTHSIWYVPGLLAAADSV